jgi:hypothetical protein
MGNIPVFPKENEHFHRLFIENTKYIFVCNNKRCGEHMCSDSKCRKNLFKVHWKYNYCKKVKTIICQHNCLCHLNRCNTPYKNVNNHSNNISDTLALGTDTLALGIIFDHDGWDLDMDD